MSTLTILFVLPLLIIFSYLFDAFAKKTKFPSVILLMATGIIIRILVSFTDYENFSFLGSLPQLINKVTESRYNKSFIIIFFQIYNSYVQYKTHTEKIHSL